MSYIHPSAIIYDNVTIQEGAYIGPGCIIGCPPEIVGYKGENKGVWICPGARLEKMVVVDGGSKMKTLIGMNTFIMSQVHIGHDCFIGHRATIAAGATLAGHVKVDPFAFIGINAAIHQHQIIGMGAMIGAGSVVPKRTINSMIMPFQTFVGVPARYIGYNKVGIERNGFSMADVNEATEQYLEEFGIKSAQ
jgi:UDP-N-acetylglucosamine acyltransferase